MRQNYANRFESGRSKFALTSQMSNGNLADSACGVFGFGG
jgi:hypothetical protein